MVGEVRSSGFCTQVSLGKSSTAELCGTYRQTCAVTLLLECSSSLCPSMEAETRVDLLWHSFKEEAKQKQVSKSWKMPAKGANRWKV